MARACLSFSIRRSRSLAALVLVGCLAGLGWLE
jgi:hypothetical protein